MRSSESIIIWGSLLIVVVAALATVIWPVIHTENKPSAAWRTLSDLEAQGRLRYIANGCTYCHSQYIRPQDWGIGAERIAQEGDYFMQSPHLLGSERTGPDLSQEGGEHTDDWHIAHFANPRFTRPRSLMPSFAYEGEENLRALIAYLQSLGGRLADDRVEVQNRFRKEAIASIEAGTDENIRWLHSRVPPVWRAMQSETPASEASIARGEKIYQDYCLGCHGAVGDGNGPAANYLYPRPVNFTTVKRHLIDGQYIGGILYYQIMNGVTGTAMPYFKKDLESAKIWDVGNFVMVNFINHRDDQIPTVGMPVSDEGREAAPVTEEPDRGPVAPGTGAVK